MKKHILKIEDFVSDNKDNDYTDSYLASTTCHKHGHLTLSIRTTMELNSRFIIAINKREIGTASTLEEAIKIYNEAQE